MQQGTYAMQSNAGTVARFQEINTFLIGAQTSAANGGGDINHCADCTDGIRR